MARARSLCVGIAGAVALIGGCRPMGLQSTVHEASCVRRVYVVVDRFGDDFSRAAFDSLRDQLEAAGVEVGGRSLTGLELGGSVEAEIEAFRPDGVLHVSVRRVEDNYWHVDAAMGAPGGERPFWTGYFRDILFTEAGAGRIVGEEVAAGLRGDGIVAPGCGVRARAEGRRLVL